MESISCFSKTSTNEFNELSSKTILGDEETAKTDGVCVGDLLSTNKHEPLDASHGAQIMVREVGVPFYCSNFSLNYLLNLASIYKGKQ